MNLSYKSHLTNAVNNLGNDAICGRFIFLPSKIKKKNHLT